MSKSKDKRIKKLKKIHIWPSIVGLFLIILVFAVVMSIALVMSGTDLIQSKLVDNSKVSERIGALFEDYNPETKDEIEQKVMTYIEVLETIDTVAVIDKDKNEIWSSNGEYPVRNENLNMEVWYSMADGAIDERFTMFIAEGDNDMLIIEDDEISFDEDYFNEKENETEIDLTEPIIEVKIWFVVPVNDMEVMVRNNIAMYGQDFLMTMACMAICAILLFVFVIYYICTIVGLIHTMRKTSKIMYTDMVTGGDNWLSFIRKGTNLLKKNKNGKRNYAVVHFEMRKYNSFCTCFGVNKGQELVEQFRMVLKNKVQSKEVVAHQENAAFGFLLAYNDTAELEQRIRDIESSLGSVLKGMKVYFGSGVYLVQKGEYDIEQLYNNAMTACEMLGEEAKNATAYFDVEMNKQKLWERKVEDDMDAALANREFRVYLQPKISTSEEELGGAEALVRWIHPTEGFIPPNRFIPIFEKNGFILKLDDYMLEEIAKVQAGWLAEGRKLVPISVNVSRAHFTREDLAEHICGIVDRYNVPHNVIELELTESAFFDDKKVLLNTVQKLRAAGFPVSMDDFGAGYSSLNSLKELQIDVLKIDADFFRGVDEQERGMLIVSEVIDLAKKLNMKIVAEGIESREQVEFLTEQECDLIQGYFYAKPMPVNEFAEKYGN